MVGISPNEELLKHDDCQIDTIPPYDVREMLSPKWQYQWATLDFRE